MGKILERRPFLYMFNMLAKHILPFVLWPCTLRITLIFAVNNFTSMWVKHKFELEMWKREKKEFRTSLSNIKPRGDVILSLKQFKLMRQINGNANARMETILGMWLDTHTQGKCTWLILLTTFWMDTYVTDGSTGFSRFCHLVHASCHSDQVFVLVVRERERERELYQCVYVFLCFYFSDNFN